MIGLRQRRPAIHATAVAMICATFALQPASASAGDRERAAAEIFRTGSEAFARGEFRAAALAFESAFREDPRAASAYNAARAWERAGEPARAADLYQAARDLTGLTAEDLADANARLTALELQLGLIDVVAPVLVSVAHASRIRGPVRIHLAPGEHHVQLDTPDGRTETRQVIIEAAATVRLAPTVTQAKPRAPSPQPAPPAAALDTSKPPLATLGWFTLAGSAALGGVAIALGVLALDARDEFDAGGSIDRDLHDRAASLRTWTNVAWIASGAAAVSGVTLLVAAASIDRPRTRASTTTLRLGPTGVTVCTPF